MFLLAMNDPRPPLSDNAQGALWMLASVAGATGMTIAVRLLTPELHTSMIVFLRAGIGVFIVLPFFWRAKRSGSRLRFTAWKLHLLRGCLTAVAMNAGYYAIWHLPLATASILFFMAPVFATLLAGPMLGEHVGPRRWSAIGAGFLGAVIILRPGVSEFDPVMVVALISSVAFASTLLLGKITARTDGSDAVFVSSSVIVVFATLPPALFHWALPDALWRWAVLGVLIAASSLRTYADIRAYVAGEAGYLAPFAYLRLLTVGGAGYLLFRETIDLYTIAGGTIIIAATLFIALREATLRPGPGMPLAR